MHIECLQHSKYSEAAGGQFLLLLCLHHCFYHYCHLKCVGLVVDIMGSDS